MPQGSIPYVSMCTVIHPGAEPKEYAQFHDESVDSATTGLHRIPLEYDAENLDEHLPGLMNIASFLAAEDGSVGGRRLLACVGGIGPTQRFRPANRDVDVEFVDIDLHDETGSCVLRLWEDKINSTKHAGFHWKPNETILLITNPTRFEKKVGKQRTVYSGIGNSTLVEINPVFSDADWLRRWVSSGVKRERVGIPVPVGIWDLKSVVGGPARTLFTIAEVDEFTRLDATEIFTGKLNLVVLGVNLLETRRRSLMCCGEWYVTITLCH